MSSTSDQTTQQSNKTRLIIDEVGVDTETGIIGRGHSYDNGKTFTVDKTIYGRIFHKSDHDQVWKGIQDKVKTVVEPAKSAADSAVAYANDAIEKSRVNSQAIDDINSAVSDAASDAAVARSDGLRAWNAAQSNVNLIDLNYASASASISSARTEALAAADEAKKSASAAQADIVVVKSSVAAVQADVTATRSDVAVAKSDIADTKTTLTQTASDLNSKITGVETSLADTTSTLSDAKTAFNSDVAEAKNLANAAQTTADSAVKSVSSVADGLTAVASQAKANTDGITKVTSDVGLLQTTVADNSGNISTVQETAKQIQQAVSDNAGNITIAKQTADSAVTVASDAKSNATVAVQTASQASVTAKDASGQAASAVLTANGALTTASNAKSDATVAIQTASGASLTATNAKDDATVAKQTASEAKVQASNAESDFAQISIRANKIEANVADNSGAIASVQQTANGLTTTVGKVDDRVKKIEDTTNWMTKTGPLDMDTLTTTQNIYYRDTNLKNADGEAGWAYIQVVSVGERVTQTVWHDRSSIQHTRTGAVSGSSYNWDVWNQSATNSQVAAVKQTVDGITTTVSNIQGDVSQLKVSASSASVALSDAAGNISNLQATAKSFSAALSDTNSKVASVTATASELETKYADAAGDISQIKTDAKGMTQTISDAQGDITKLKTRADGFDTQFANINGDINKIQTDATGTTQTLANTKSDVAVLQSRADGLDAKYADAAGDINTLKADASGFSQTLVSAKGDISTLQSTATGLKNTLTDAQGNISTLQSDVSGLKKTTSDHTGSIATLQATANTLTSQMSSAQGDISTLKQTASGISSQVSGMETSLSGANSKINSITSNGGGRNLWLNSKAFGQTDVNVPEVDFNTDSDGMVTAHITGRGGFYGKWRYIYANNIDPFAIGDSSTFSVEMKGSGTIAIGREGDFTKDVTLTDAWTRYAVSGTVNSTNRAHIIYNESGKDCDAYVRLPMVEEGIVVHPWSPAPEDTDAKITANTTAIEQNKQAIALKADQTTVDKTNGTVQQLQSQLQVQADQIASKVSSSDLDALNDKFNNMQIGGRNLLTNTDTDISVTSHTTDGWPAWANVDTGFSFEHGKTYTFSAEATNSTDKIAEASIHVFEWSTNTQVGIYAFPADGERHSVTFTIPNDSHNYHLLLYAGHAGIVPGVDVTTTYHHPKLEFGNVATDWSPAPEDSQTYTQTYTQTQIKQTADSWNANLASVKDGLTQSYTNLSATVNGIQAQVYNSDGSSKITQLSTAVQSKVSQGDYNSQITQLQNDINLRVTKGDVVSQINQEAGGNTLIQVSNGKGSLILDADNTVITGKAWIPVASIADLTADQIQAGTLTGSTVHLGDSSGNTIDLGGLATNYVGFHSKATNGDQTYIDHNGIHNYGATYDTKISQGMITTNLLSVNGGGLIDFRSGGSGVTLSNQEFQFYNSGSVNGGLSFSGSVPIAPAADGASGNELRIRYDRSFAVTPISDESSRICASAHSIAMGFKQSGSSSPDFNITGLRVTGDRYFNLGVWSSDSKWSRVEATQHNIHMQSDDAHAWLSGDDNQFHIYRDNDDGSATATKLQVDGWAWVRGWVEAAGHSQHSALSTKTALQAIDDDEMLAMVNNTDLASFLFKTDVASGETHRHIGLIIDDVHDVAQYQAPQDFIAPNGVSRDDDNMIGALFGAVKALTKRIKTLESKVG